MLSRLCLVFFLAPLVCEGFDFTFTALSTANDPACGILRCSEQVTDRILAGLTVYTLNPNLTVGWKELASVTPQSPSQNREFNGFKINGTLFDNEGKIDVEMSKLEDCDAAEYLCACVLVQTDSGKRTLIKSNLRSIGSSSSVASQDKTATDTDVGLGLSHTPSVNSPTERSNKDGRILISVQEKLKYLEKQMEDFFTQDRSVEARLENLKDALKDQISDKLQTIDHRVGDRLDRLENRLEDKLSRRPYWVGSNTAEDICGHVYSDISAMVDSFKAVEQNLTKLGDEVNRTGSVATQTKSKVSALDLKLDDLTSKISNVSSLTGNLVSAFDSFRSSCSSKAQAPVDGLFDVLSTGKKEWKLAFRGTAHNNVPVYQAYLYGTGIPSEVEPGCKQFNHSLPCSNHYRNRDALENWQNVDKVLFAIYKKGRMVKKVMFNARDSNYLNWFTADRVFVSSWLDLKRLPHNVFSIDGYVGDASRRRFYMSNEHNSCPLDQGWFVAVDTSRGDCPWDNVDVIPAFLYASGPYASKWAPPTMRRADAIGIFVKYL